MRIDFREFRQKIKTLSQRFHQKKTNKKRPNQLFWEFDAHQFVFQEDQR